MNKNIKANTYYKLTKEEDLNKIVYPHVKQYLINNNMELIELAEKTHMTITNLRTLLRGNIARPRLQTFKKIMDATNLTMPQLLQRG